MAEQEPLPVEQIEADEPDETTGVWAIPPNRPRKVYAGMWGPFEIAAVAAGSLAVTAALVTYFLFVIPSNRELARNRSEADRLEAEQISAKSKYGEITSTQDQVTKLVASVDDFQTRFLPVSSTGQAALYQRLNALIGAYDLVNTSGPDYAPLATADLNSAQQNEEEKGRAKFKSLFPGVYVTVTVEGSYQNLRRFIRELETGREFIVVSTVELAPSDSEGQKDQSKPNPGTAANPTLGPGGQPIINPTTGQPMAKGIPATGNQPLVQTPAQMAQSKKGKMHGELVSLHIELAAYFRRAGFVPMSAAPERK